MEQLNDQTSELLKKINTVAATSSTVLLTGETGVGKSTVAKLIHQKSSRKDNPFISVHCGAIAEGLVESELFGHEKGSFTGAIKRKLGRFELANGGTIFLDEIGTVSLGTQIKLLQVLQDQLFQRVGGESDIRVDVRVISASNENLKEKSDLGDFRKDLFFRLNVFPIDIPPLRERIEDIQYLTSQKLEELNKRYTKSILTVDDNAMEALKKYSWPGNIRELENVLERAILIESTNTLMPESLPQELFEGYQGAAIVAMDSELTLAETRAMAIEDVERQYLKKILEKTKGRINDTATIAGVTARQIHKLMSKYEINKSEFK